VTGGAATLDPSYAARGHLLGSGSVTGGASTPPAGGGPEPQNPNCHPSCAIPSCPGSLRAIRPARKESTMSRRYDEPIEVTSALARTPRTTDPEAFIWRGRLFVVRAVIDRWQERRAWWREVGTEVQVRTEDGPTAGSSTGSRLGAVGTGAEPGGRAGVGTGIGAGVGAAQHERERQVWRVEASAGKAAGTGVFDLGADGVSADGSPRWLLLRAHD
ncbi:MAG: DUF6504 family protein, partial [Nostocoides sp.]